MKTNSSYPDVVLNAFKSVQAWKSLSLVLIGVLIFETVALGWLAGQRSVILMPQNLPNNKTAIELNLGEPFSPDYLTSVAKGDAYSLLNWTPDSIDTQYAMFLARLTPSLNSIQKSSLVEESKTHREEGLTQSFYVTKSFVKGATVSLDGILVRAAGGREVFRGPASYEFSYTNAGNGMLLVAGVAQPVAGPKEKPSAK